MSEPKIFYPLTFQLRKPVQKSVINVSKTLHVVGIEAKIRTQMSLLPGQGDFAFC